MVQKLDYLRETPSQTAGPYVHIGLSPRDAGFDIYDNQLGEDIAGPDAKGERITIQGRVLDGTGAPVRDVLIETWQANADGIYPGRGAVEDGFRGWGRVVPDAEGVFTIKTVKPGAAPGRHDTVMAPHLNLWLVARGINVGLNTRMYFADEEALNADDAVLNLIEQAHRRDSLLAQPDGDVYRFDIHLQGERETVFLDI
ncbi:protocatechuate 3,4-dioxygenase subunit alpha [Salipiger sp. IMCC34102]|uniref:protocatechuate 3,4-dioxygenase subunit alpha n=1 Tax=Salipiger sp. IMCC34102 TaxID=2510647 RepID=UPI00101DB25C|nr:protocatechuate 3,4-dioxygenase subunit alpha [Salipiger sp. IMCC34102]RYH03139.1 protocatechuate 3,4-dioxygenase subunit alpha [Salipiger sp. IMCC34102]